MRQKRLIALTMVGVVGSAGVGWAAGAQVKSPAQIAADTEPPEASLITVPVESRSLSSTVTTRGTVRYGEPQTVTLAASTVTGGTSALVTAPPEKGATLGENSIALEVSGRPVQVLQGTKPMYRDLRPGDKGDDVRQLEEALARLGFRPGEVDGVYDVSTEGAVDAWYESSGYASQGPTDEQREQLRSARSAVSSAEDQVLQAEETLETARRGTTLKDITQAENEVKASERNLAAAEEALTEARTAAKAATASIAAARDAISTARAALRTTQASEAKTRSDGELTLAQSETQERARELAVDGAEDALAQARAALQRAQDDPETPPGEIDRLEGEVRAAERSLELAERELADQRQATAAVKAGVTLANRQAEQATQQAEQAVRDAQAGVGLKEQEAEKAGHLASSAERALASAHDGLYLAKVSLEDLRHPKDTKSAQAQLDKAKRDLADARANLSELDGKVGVVVPANEVLFFASLPLRVDEAKVQRGDDGGKEVMVVSTSRLAIDSSLSIADSKLVEAGDEVTLKANDLGIEVTGKVSAVADKPGTNGVDSQRVYMEVLPDEAPPELTGANVQLSIAVQSTEGEVLAVPLAALSVASDGSSRVQVLDDDGATRYVTVDLGLSAQGYAEVRPTEGQLGEGDRVVVGREGSSDASGDDGEGS